MEFTIDTTQARLAIFSTLVSLGYKPRGNTRLGTHIFVSPETMTFYYIKDCSGTTNVKGIDLVAELRLLPTNETKKLYLSSLGDSGV